MSSYKYLYTFNTDIVLNNEQEVSDFIKIHAINKAEFEAAKTTVSGASNFQYKNDTLEKVEHFFESQLESVTSIEDKQFKYFDNVPNPVLYFEPAKTQSSIFIGGKLEPYFSTIGLSAIDVPFQRIITFSKKSPDFSWLPFEELTIVYPIYAGITGYLFLDYTNPLQPQLIDPNEKIHYPFGHFPKDGVHIFERVNVKTTSILALNEYQLHFEEWSLGGAGVPSWIQFPELPYCPKTAKLMRFLGQVDTSRHVKIKDSNLSSPVPYFNERNKYLEFGSGSGTLYIFIEPESKVVGMLIQDT